MVRVRFAPSPTGFLHVGGARTALFNFLFARKEKGKFILRIEDTDLERSEREYEEKLMESLRWLGLLWDEGPDVGGDHGPYRQSERVEIYREYAERLVKEGKAYYVYAYPEEIEEMREKLLSEGKAPHYSQEMFEKFDTPGRRKEYEEKGLRPAVFFKMPRKDYVLNDVVKGEVVFKTGAIGDFVIMRSNGLPTYNFACVVDDMLMEITHVIRGDDHLSNTLRQLALYEAFEKAPPVFAHVSTILGPDGKKLSKRHGATSVEAFRDMGYLPEALVNYLALLGWSHPEGKELLTLEELISSFSLDRLSPNPAIFDPQKLKWMNGYYLRNMPIEKLAELAKPFFEKAGIKIIDEEYFKKVLEITKERVEVLSEFPEESRFFFEDPAPVEIPEEMKGVFSQLKEELQNVRWTMEEITPVFKKVLKQHGVKPKEFYMTLRRVLTGREEGPELVNIIPLLGKEIFLRRIERSLGG
ncbi:MULTISPECIES: glutamate--tRNA ligase [unclassified Thermotoga]|uniref:glutamate--tRNA ligase n=1 Tax=unclassified Thermotoga TaxID=2631113 RepID=UPI000280E775|nr:MULTISPECIES: glutamate--tRNA ligase [unclassified Thermotoga]AIY87010.1 glutamyl-tRNA synthetase [Thermotoga sp. 2812B]EJX25727.1 glutamyl-tRNA synthetase [Thermotoga sp. EMP]